MKKKRAGVSLCELARRLGRAKSGLHRLVTTGAIPRLPDGTFDVDAVRLALEQNINLAKSPIWRRQRDGDVDDGDLDCVELNGIMVYVYGRSTEAEAIEAKQMTMDEARRPGSDR